MTGNNTEDGYILRLNDDCFYKIYKYLTIYDWCSLADTCTRLQTVSDDCFKRQYKSFELKIFFETKTFQFNLYSKGHSKLFELKEWFYQSSFENKSSIQKLMHSFGKFIYTIDIDGNIKNLQRREHTFTAEHTFDNHENVSRVLKWLDHCCSGLLNLKLTNIPLDTATITQCDRIFLKLHRLTINRCSIDDTALATSLTYCRSLKELELTNLLEINGEALVQQFHTLQSISIKCCNHLHYAFIQIFFAENLQLNSLTIVQCEYIELQVFQDVSNLPNLEILSLCLLWLHSENIVFKQLMHLSRLTKLKRFEIGFGFDMNNSEFLSALSHNQIENLYLFSFIINDELIQNLCNLKTLKTLKFHYSYPLDSQSCSKLARELTNLSEIHVYKCQNVTFNELKEFVEHSTKLKKIAFDPNETLPSFTEHFLPILGLLQRKSNADTLNIHLNYYNATKNKFEKENSNMLLQYQHVFNLLPMEVQDESAYFYDGNWLWKRRRLTQSFR